MFSIREVSCFDVWAVSLGFGEVVVLVEEAMDDCCGVSENIAGWCR